MSTFEDVQKLLGALAGQGDYRHIIPPPGFIQVDRNNNLINAPAGENLLETIQLTSGYKGWIRAVGLQSNDFSTSYFSIRENGQGLRDYTVIRVPLGSPETPKEVFIELQPNISYTLHGVCTGGEALRWNLWGWFFPDFPMGGQR